MYNNKITVEQGSWGVKKELGAIDLGSELGAKICGSELGAKICGSEVPAASNHLGAKICGAEMCNLGATNPGADPLGPNMSLSFRRG